MKSDAQAEATVSCSDRFRRQLLARLVVLLEPRSSYTLSMSCDSYPNDLRVEGSCSWTGQRGSPLSTQQPTSRLEQGADQQRWARHDNYVVVVVPFRRA